MESRLYLRRFAWLSIGAAILTIALKAAAYFLTGSVGLLSDALESLVNLAGAVIALSMLGIASRPEDESHHFGHSKAEYFSSGVEGGFIIIAAAGIGFTAVERMINPRPLEQLLAHWDEAYHNGVELSAEELCASHSSPDLLLGMDAAPQQRNIVGLLQVEPALAREGIRLRQFGQRLIEQLGGRRIHNAWVVPGGVSEPLRAAVRWRC